jgi:hypothetical protein
MSSTERPPGELPGVFARQDGIKPYLFQSIPLGPPQCFLGSFRLIGGEGFFVTPNDQRYRVLSRGQERHPLIRHLRAATPGVTETDGGGFRVHQGFAVIRALSPAGAWCWLLIDATTATAAIRAIDDAFRCFLPVGQCSQPVVPDLAHERVSSGGAPRACTATT